MYFSPAMGGKNTEAGKSEVVAERNFDIAHLRFSNQ